MLEIGLFHNGASSLPVITTKEGVTFNDGALPEVHRVGSHSPCPLLYIKSRWGRMYSQEATALEYQQVGDAHHTHQARKNAGRA